MNRIPSAVNCGRRRTSKILLKQMHVILIMMKKQNFQKFFFFFSLSFCRLKWYIKASKFFLFSGHGKLNCVCFCVKYTANCELSFRIFRNYFFFFASAAFYFNNNFIFFLNFWNADFCTLVKITLNSCLGSFYTNESWWKIGNDTPEKIEKKKTKTKWT